MRSWRHEFGSHVRLETDEPNRHALTIPNHSPLKVGTLAAILVEVSAQRRLTRDELLTQLGF